jgi:hypothetical protein
MSNFFTRIFRATREDGVQVMDEALVRLNACAQPIESIRDMIKLAESKGLLLAEPAILGLGIAGREAFVKAALAGTGFARQKMFGFKCKSIDCSNLDDVEIYVIITALNALIAAGDAADNLATPEAMVDESLRLESPVGKALGTVLAANKALFPVRLKRSTRVRDDYLRFLHTTLLPQLPPDIVNQPVANFRDQ